MEEDEVLLGRGGGGEITMIFRYIEFEFPKNEILRKQLTLVAHRKTWTRGTICLKGTMKP